MISSFTRDGLFPVYAGVKGSANDQVNILMPASLAGAGVKIGYEDSTGTFVDLQEAVTDGVLEAGKQYHVDHGYAPGLLFSISGFVSEFEIALNGQT